LDTLGEDTWSFPPVRDNLLWVVDWRRPKALRSYMMQIYVVNNTNYIVYRLHCFIEIGREIAKVS